MRRNLLDRLHTIDPLQDIKKQVEKVERKNDNLTVIIVAGVIITLLSVIAVILLKKNKYDYDAYEDDYFVDDFDDEFEDFDDDFIDEDFDL